MKSHAFCSFLFAAQLIAAFPSGPISATHRSRDPPPAFDAATQLVSTSGDHVFIAPGPNDARGPCPGLNALANHGYIPRNGYALIPEMQLAVETVFGMGPDLAAFLTLYGAALDGDGLGWSIAGKKNTGIGGSHGNYETDSSPFRGDLFQYGDNTALVMSQFMSFYNMQPDPETANYDYEVVKEFRYKRFNESIAKNPYFYYGPFNGVAVSQAAFTFIFRFFANHTEEAPEGLLNKDVLKSFFAISGPEDNLTWTPGYERIPDNWYTRNALDQYGLLLGHDNLADDVDDYAVDHPWITEAGCNTGEVDSYTMINAADPSAENGTQHPLCFAIAAINEVSYGTEGTPQLVVEDFTIPLMNQLGCEAVPKYNESIAQACPGWSFYGGPSASVAPGAMRES